MKLGIFKGLNPQRIELKFTITTYCVYYLFIPIFKSPTNTTAIFQTLS